VATADSNMTRIWTEQSISDERPATESHPELDAELQVC